MGRILVHMSPSTDDHPRPWVEQTSDDIGQKAAKQTWYEYLPPGNPTFVQFTGQCPVCEDPFLYDHPLEYLRTVAAEPVIVICQCSETHTGRPENTSGCGAYWVAEVPE